MRSIPKKAYGKGYMMYGRGGYFVRRKARLMGRRPVRILGGGYPASTRARATRALSLIRKFKKEQEVKIISNDGETMQIPIAGNWIIEGFGPYCQEGSGLEHRIGQKTTVQSLSMRILIKLTALEATGTSVRIVVLIDRRPNGGNETTDHIFATNNQINSCYNYQPDDGKGKFQFILDKTLAFDSTQTMRAIKLYYKKPTEIQYDTGNAGTVADIHKNNFLICAMAEGNAAAIDIDYGFCFRFTDK